MNTTLQEYFETRRCSRCGEVTFVNNLRLTEEDNFVCTLCSGRDA